LNHQTQDDKHTHTHTYIQITRPINTEQVPIYTILGKIGMFK